jgi:primosomal protein N' (replication factor Y) (superfamily II helicase)
MLGTGTQRVEEELEERFPEARIVRMDHDTTTGKHAHDRLLKEFGSGRADILLGTQMVAKGLDFGNVTLVGVVNADTGLLLPDFRSEERTFQLLSQVAGRAGRALLAGQVLIQTRNPDRPIIRYARDHDYASFARAQLADRRALAYPPFGRLACVEFKGPRAGDAADLARRWTASLRERAAEMDVLGPEEAFISRVKKQYRFHTLVKARRTEKEAGLQAVLRDTLEACGQPPRGFRVNIDVDPVGTF